ncbi:MAG: DUF6660 family protein, partial [Bacteroidales bacterium]
FYVILLTAIPCIDASDCGYIQNTEHGQGNKDEHHGDDSGHCSPFCTCNCCATSVIFQEMLVQLNIYSLKDKQYFPLSTGFFSKSFVNIWQPPKIA